MKHRIRRLVPAICLALAAAATPARAIDVETGAADEVVPVPVSVTVTVASQYVSRGMRQTWGKPALQAGIDYAHPSGWSAGSWVSNVSDRFVEQGSVEWDVYGGYSGTAGAVGYSALVYYYKYPGALISASGTRFNYGELSAGLMYKSFYARYNHTFTRDFFGIRNARGTAYLDLGVNHELGHGYTLNLHAGEGRVAGAGNGYWDWRDLKAGVSKAFAGGLTVAAAYTRAWGATDAYDVYGTGVADSAGVTHFSNPAKGTLVLSVAQTF